YDWNDLFDQEASDGAWLKSGKDGNASCANNQFGGLAEGCSVGLSHVLDSCDKVGGKEQLYSGHYTVWGDDQGSTSIRPGYAEDCNGGNPKQFTIEGSEIDGCTPTIALYGDVTLAGDSYVLKNAALSNRTQVYGTGNGAYDLNDWVRAFKSTTGRWQACEDVNFGGKCVTFSVTNANAGSASGFRLDTHWNGNWDKKISSIRPKA